MRSFFFLLVSLSLYAKLSIVNDLQKAKCLAEKYNKPICLLSGFDRKALSAFLEDKPVEALLQNRCLFVFQEQDLPAKIEILDQNGAIFETLDVQKKEPLVLAKDVKRKIQQFYLRGV